MPLHQRRETLHAMQLVALLIQQGSDVVPLPGTSIFPPSCCYAAILSSQKDGHPDHFHVSPLCLLTLDFGFF